MVYAEIYGLLLTQWALARLICEAATETDTAPDRVKYLRTIRIVRRHAMSEATFPPDRKERALRAVKADLVGRRGLNQPRRHRSYSRVV
ncbi:hypothetical protein [Promicromonospora sp. NPDC023987]|uniref:hypothetical protein n=1 Tax=Promicromonospora sp. NPDC023987 TaxID=3155360 RepID=UPI0033E7DE68